MEQKGNQLKEIRSEQFQSLLDELKSDFPNSIHAWEFLKTIEKWRACDPTVTTKILALNGDYGNKFILFFIRNVNVPGIMGSAHKWSHRDDDEYQIREALKNCQEFPWFADGKLQLTGINEETSRVVTSEVRNKWDGEGVKYVVETGNYMYWIPIEEALAMEIIVPEGTYLANLTKKHAEIVNEHWPHHFDGSLNLITSCIRFNLAIGIFDSTTHELMAWAFQSYHGGAGLLQTREHYMRKGYGSVVIKAISREIAVRGCVPHLIVLPDNVASRTLVEKVGYRLAFRCVRLRKF